VGGDAVGKRLVEATVVDLLVAVVNLAEGVAYHIDQGVALDEGVAPLTALDVPPPLLVQVINVLTIGDDPVKRSIRLLDDADGLAVDVGDGVVDGVCLRPV
jgi:hypothetical protein